MSLRRGFTLVEVVAILLVVGVGLMGVIGVVHYGQKRMARTQARALAWETALTVAYDAQPLLGSEQQVDWSLTISGDFDAEASYTVDANGFINGLYVQRSEVSEAADITARTRLDPAAVHVTARTGLVTVDVYDGYRGELLCRYRTRLLRQIGYNDALFGAR